jgi:hypothetical protein
VPLCLLLVPDTIAYKGSFPDFSILPLNLVPCCDPCNRNKGEKWLENGVRRILAFYTDDIPDYYYLFFKLLFERSSNIPSIECSLLFSEENDKTTTIKTHFRDLKLFERYVKQVNDKITGLYIEVSEGSKDLSIDEQKSNLKRRINSLTKRFGINYWEARLYEAAIESDFFEKCYEK